MRRPLRAAAVGSLAATAIAMAAVHETGLGFPAHRPSGRLEMPSPPTPGTERQVFLQRPQPDVAGVLTIGSRTIPSVDLRPADVQVIHALAEAGLPPNEIWAVISPFGGDAIRALWVSTPEAGLVVYVPPSPPPDAGLCETPVSRGQGHLYRLILAGQSATVDAARNVHYVFFADSLIETRDEAAWRRLLAAGAATPRCPASAGPP